MLIFPTGFVSKIDSVIKTIWLQCTIYDFSLDGSSLLLVIDASLPTGYKPQLFKAAVIKPLLKKPTLDSGSLVK